MSTGSLQRATPAGHEHDDVEAVVEVDEVSAAEVGTDPVSSFTSTVPVRRFGGLQPAVDDLPADRYLERELSWLQFNERVLQLAMDPLVPLLERCRFLAIFASNLDEYFMVRVAGLKRRIGAGLAVRTSAGIEPRELLERVARLAHELMAQHAAVFQDDVRPALAGEGITIVRWDDLAEADQEPMHEFFRERLFPVLTPLAVDPAHPFPYISGLSLNLAVLLQSP
jgi:polyphosphate kinase